MTDIPKVSVVMPTYNHAPYIAQAVVSAVTQQTDFPIEVIVGDDASTDSTREILLQLQRQYPDTLRLRLNERNIGGQLNFAAIFGECQGQYVAMLEGDDYWTDPWKLQKQADALDAHPDWAICFHPTRVVYEDNSQPTRLYPPDWSQDVVTIDELFRHNFMSTCSVTFRNRLFGAMPDWHSEIVPGDWVLHLLNADQGKIGFLKEVMATYRVHARGLWSSKNWQSREAEVLRMFSRIDHHLSGKYARQIDEYRIGRVSALIDQVETAERRVTRLTTIVSTLKRPAAPGQDAPARSNIYRLGRTVMRPLERLGRQCGTAIGLRRRIASES